MRDMSLNREWVVRGCLVLLAMQAGPSTNRASTQTPANATPSQPQQPANQSPREPQTSTNTSPSTTPAGNQTPGNATPGHVTPVHVTPGNASPGGPPTLDPGAATFLSPAGMMVVTVKPDKTADYEAVIVALQEALAKAEDAETRTLAAGWRVFKATDLDAKANAIYLHLLDPAVTGTDYRPSLWLDKMLSGAPPELLAKYRDSFGAPPTKLSLVEFAKMSVAPLAKPANGSPDSPTSPAKPANVSPGAPGKNGSPDAPSTPAKPGNGSPVAPGFVARSR
jgi:hypothetical protein